MYEPRQLTHPRFESAITIIIIRVSSSIEIARHSSSLTEQKFVSLPYICLEDEKQWREKKKKEIRLTILKWNQRNFIVSFIVW